MKTVKKALMTLFLIGFCPFLAHGMATGALQVLKDTIPTNFPEKTSVAKGLGLAVLLGSTVQDCSTIPAKLSQKKYRDLSICKKSLMISDRLVHWIALYTSMGLAYGFKTQYPLLYTLAGTAAIGIPMKFITTTLLEKYNIPELPLLKPSK